MGTPNEIDGLDVTSAGIDYSSLTEADVAELTDRDNVPANRVDLRLLKEGYLRIIVDPATGERKITATDPSCRPGIDGRRITLFPVELGRYKAELAASRVSPEAA